MKDIKESNNSDKNLAINSLNKVLDFAEFDCDRVFDTLDLDDFVVYSRLEDFIVNLKEEIKKIEITN